MAVISLNSSHVGEYPRLGWRATRARPIAHISAHEASRGFGTTPRDVVWMAGSYRRSLSKVSAWCCSSCSQSVCCRRGQKGVWSLESSEVGALSPAWCTPCESGPDVVVQGPVRPRLHARACLANVSSSCARLRGWECWTRMPQSAIQPCRTPCLQRDVRGEGRSLARLR